MASEPKPTTIFNGTNELITVTITEFIHKPTVDETKETEADEATEVQEEDNNEEKLLPQILALEVVNKENNNPTALEDGDAGIKEEKKEVGSTSTPEDGLKKFIRAIFVEEDKEYEKIETKVDIEKHASYTHKHMVDGCIQVGDASILLGTDPTDLTVARFGNRFILCPGVVDNRRSIEISIQYINRVLATRPDATCRRMFDALATLRTNSDRVKESLKKLVKENLIAKGHLTNEMCDKSFSLLGLASVAGWGNTVVIGPNKMKEEELKDTIQLLTLITQDVFNNTDFNSRLSNLKSVANTLINEYIHARQKADVREMAQRERLYNILLKQESTLLSIAAESLEITVELPLSLHAIYLHLLVLQELATIDPTAMNPNESPYGREESGMFSTFAVKYSQSIDKNWRKLQDRRTAAVSVKQIFSTQSHEMPNMIDLHPLQHDTELWVYSIIDEALNEDKQSDIFSQASDYNPEKIPDYMNDFAKMHAAEMVSQLDVYLGYPSNIVKELKTLSEEHYISFIQFQEATAMRRNQFCPCWPL